MNVKGTHWKEWGICMRPIQKNNGTMAQRQHLSEDTQGTFILLSKQADAEQIYSMCFGNAIYQGI